jgi:hypothetical protein
MAMAARSFTQHHRVGRGKQGRSKLWPWRRASRASARDSLRRAQLVCERGGDGCGVTTGRHDGGTPSDAWRGAVYGGEKRAAGAAGGRAHLPRDPSLEQDAVSGTAAVENALLSALSASRVEAAVVLLPSLAFLPSAAQRWLRPWQLLVCLGSPYRAVDTAAAAEVGLCLVHGGEAHGLKSRRTLLGSLPPRRRRVHSHPPPPSRPQHSAGVVLRRTGAGLDNFGRIAMVL